MSSFEGYIVSLYTDILHILLLARQSSFKGIKETDWYYTRLERFKISDSLGC